jgi:large subunit ribosomal protein L17
MRHRKKTCILDRKKASRESLLRNLATSLVLYEKIETTRAKAYFLRPFLEHCITVGKGKDLASRRALLRTFYDKNAVKKIIELLSSRYAERKGGYCRIVPLRRRSGDGAEIVRIELV